jgi:hypothetical protein
MTSSSSTDFSVSWILYLSPHVARNNITHAFEALKNGFGAPKAPARKISSCSFIHSCLTNIPIILNKTYSLSKKSIKIGGIYNSCKKTRREKNVFLN